MTKNWQQWLTDRLKTEDIDPAGSSLAPQQQPNQPRSGQPPMGTVVAGPNGSWVYKNNGQVTHSIQATNLQQAQKMMQTFNSGQQVPGIQAMPPQGPKPPGQIGPTAPGQMPPGPTGQGF